MIRAYLKKKAWAWPGLSMKAQLLIVAGVFLVAIVDAVLRSGGDTEASVAQALWVCAVVVLMLVSPVVGLVSFSAKYESLLEYLPIRRRSMWLANAAHGLGFLLVLFLAVVWNRVLFGEVRDAQPLDDWRGAALFALLIVYGFSLGAFARFVFKRALWGVFALFGLLVATGTTIGVLTGTFALYPSEHDFVPLLVVASAVFLTASLTLGCVVPSASGRAWLARSAGVTGLALGIIVSTVYGSAVQWRDLSRDELTQVKLSRIDASTALAVVRGRRSGFHAIAVDLGEKRCTHLGRGVDQGYGIPGGRPLVTLRYMGDSVLPRRRFLSFIEGVGNQAFALPAGFSIEESRYSTEHGWSTLDGRWHLLVGDRAGSQSKLAVLDDQGQLVRTLRAQGNYLPRLAVVDGGLVYKKPSQDPTTVRWVHHDLETGHERSLYAGPGRIYTFAHDLSAAIVLRTKDGDGGAERRALERVRLSDGAATTIVGYDETLPEREASYGYLYDLPTPLLPKRATEPEDVLVRPQVFFDAQLTKAVWFRETVRPSGLMSGELVAIDLATGRRRSLSDSDQVATFTALDTMEPNVFRGLGFVGSDRFVYVAQGRLTWVDLTTGDVLHRMTGVDDHVRLSPGGTRALVTETAGTALHAKAKDGTHATFDGAAMHSFGSPANSSLSAVFLDDERLLQFRRGTLRVLRLDGQVERTIPCPALDAR